ncbi:uncharacterized protein LOC119739781 [Patiria miniata]|uniref:UBZ1-type domain-containing protein n=1 Tax=Patiria miniata TaxID=46514 RepID=A0A914B4P7_PATMI|nr:uncharacterized protein LOC119739781 [Patiria miniata]
MNLIKCHRSESGVNRKDKLEREKSQDEDMYGPEGTLGEEEFSPYNLKRLCMKLMKLQEFPAKYQSMMEHISTSLGSSSVDDTVSTSTCISAQSGLTTGGRSSCFVGIHNIKLPPTNLSKQALQGRDDSINQPVMYYEESPVTRNDIEVSHRQDGNNTYPLLTEGSLSFEQACGPPTHVDVIKINKESSVPDLYCGKSCSSVPSVNSTPDEVKCIDEKENECEEDIIGEHECVAVPQVLISKQLHPATHENTEIKNSQGSECTLLHKKSPYMPGSDSVHDQLVTAHSSLHFGAEGVPKVECPVCLQNFPTDTSEETVTTHVNLHFDEQLKNSHSFEILNNQSLH